MSAYVRALLQAVSNMHFKRLGSSSVQVGVIGQGCMGLGGEYVPDSERDEDHVRSLKLGIDLGMTFLDTAEVYGGGHSEELVGRAIAGIRDRVIVATKFSPEHNGFKDVIAAAERSLRRLRTDHIDLYQVHWPNPAVPVEETMEAMSLLVRQGKVRHIGVSNFSVRELCRACNSLSRLYVVANQVEYNLLDRFIEKRILPYCRDHDISVIAYSPLDKGKTSGGGALLEDLARKYGKTSAQIVLSWLVHQPQVIVIPRASDPRHVRENAVAADFVMDAQDIERISAEFSAEPAFVDTDSISVRLQGEGNRRTYQTLKEALDNELNFVPSPRDLAEEIKSGEPIKPVRLIRREDPNGRFGFDLVEGRIRFWAWVIAHEGKTPVPAYIRNCQGSEVR